MNARRIMVPLDGSTMAEAALPVAENLARRGETTFFLVRAAFVPERGGCTYLTLDPPASVSAGNSFMRTCGINPPAGSAYGITYALVTDAATRNPANRSIMPKGTDRIFCSR